MANTPSSFSAGSTRETSIATIADKTGSAFPIGSVWYNVDLLFHTAQDFGKANLFKVRKEAIMMILCSRASNYNSKQRSEGRRVGQRAGYAISCSCPWMLKFLNSKKLLPKVTVTHIHAKHNHTCCISGVVSAVKFSGNATTDAVLQVTQLLAPLIASKKKLPYNLIRWTINPHVAKGIVLDS